MDHESDDIVPRFHIISMNLWFKENCDKMVTGNEDNAIDFKKPFRIFMCDEERLHEIYNSAKLEKLYDDIAGIPIPKRIKKASGEDKEPEDSGSSCKQTNSENYTALPVMGPNAPNGNIIPWYFFYVIIHQDTGIPEIDDAHLVEATPYYLKGEAMSKSDIVSSSIGHLVPYIFYPCPFQVDFPFGHLSVVGMIYEPSWLVTVSVYWVNNHVAESYISGLLEFYCGEYPYSCELLETPENKVLKVVHGVPIPLLRSAFAVPFVSKFTVEADLVDPINNSSVQGRNGFDFDGFFKEEDCSKSGIIVGRGAKIKVVLTMKRNDSDFLYGPPIPKK